MKKLLILTTVLLIQGDIFSQTYKYWIEFTDKNNSPYSVSNPSAFLSARAIQKRTKFSIPVQYNDLPPNPAYIDSVLSTGVHLLNRSRWFNAISINTTDTSHLAAIRALPFVKHSTFVLSMVKPHSHDRKSFIETTTRNSPYAVDTFNYAASYNQSHMIGVDCLNNMGYRGKGKRIAVIDTRFGVAHTLPAFDSLFNRSGVLGTWDFVWEDPIVWDDTNNADVHGQEVLSTMAGNLPGQLLGDAVDADYYLLRTEDANTEYEIEDDNWTSGAEYADSAGADVITSSLGYSVFTSDPGTSYTYADMNGKVAVASMAATIAVEKGLIVCVAAGNEGGGSWQYITSPGDADSILTVGAVDPFGNYANFSSTGPTSDHRIKPDVSAQGEFTALADPNGGVTFGSGTSFATPTIAGACASLWQADSNSSNIAIMEAVRQSASQYTHPDSLLGYGIPNFCLAKTIATGLTDNKIVTNLNSIYPNPFTNDITVSFFSSIVQNVNVKMYNTLGQIITQKTWQVAGGGNTLITLGGLQNLSNGIYLVIVTDEKGRVYTGKVVK
ncbi:MAG TPA: S8/S53 family peptidase [Bacteroidia bacterium]|jgi:serine protease AprX|nr:S8/S53 family peptidase [Bacteroidia bacterium]